MFKIFIRRPVLSIVVALVIAFIGVLSLFNLPITQFPSISPPKVNVVADYPGANNELLIKSVIIPLEQALNGVPGMKYIESDAGNDGEAEINVVFKLGTDPNVDAYRTVFLQLRISCRLRSYERVLKSHVMSVTPLCILISIAMIQV